MKWFPLFFVLGCTGGALPTFDLSVPDMTVVDMAVADLTTLDFSGIMCGSSLCSGSQVCCVVPTGGSNFTAMCVASGTCQDGGVTAMCDGPEDCNGGQHCCAAGTFAGSTDGGTGNGAVTCQSTCPASVNVNGGNVSFQSRLCHAKSDCTGLAGNVPGFGTLPFDGCCTHPDYPNGSFCGPSAGALIGGYTCH